MNRFPPFEGMRYGLRTFRELTGHRFEFIQGMQTLADALIKQSDNGELTSKSFLQITTLAWEMVHYGLSHKVVNVSKNLVNLLMASDMKIPRNALVVPFRVFELCPEEGAGIPSALVVYSPTEMEANSLRKMMDLVGIGSSRSDVPTVRNLLIIFYRDKAMNQNHVILKNFDDQEDTSISEVIENWCWGPEPEAMRPTALSLLRLAFSTICYLNIENPDSVVWKNYNRPPLGEVKADSILLGSSFKQLVGHHLRSGHFRELRHERFQRTVDGAPRLVWVRPCEVSKEQEPAEPLPNKIILEAHSIPSATRLNDK